MYDIAKKLATLIEQDTKRITIGDKRDFWILTNSEKALEKVSKKEIAPLKMIVTFRTEDAERKINQLTRERVTEEELNSFSDA